MILPPVLDVAKAAVREGVAPGLSAVVVHGGRVVHESFHGDAQRVPAPRPLRPDDRFDVASITKLYVASAVARLVERGALGLDRPAARWIPAFRQGKEAITIRHLLAHASGLPAWRPFFAQAARDPVARLAFDAGAASELAACAGTGAVTGGAARDSEALVAAFCRGRELVEAGIVAEPLESAPGTRAIYSDLGFIALGLVVERVCGVSLDAAIEAEVTRPLGLSETWFVPDLDPQRAVRRRFGVSFVATRAAASRGGAVLCGAVDDDNAWSMGGVAGHAGLFSTARDVAAFGTAWLDALAGRSGWLGAATANLFAGRDGTPGSERALGWDTRSSRGSTLGARLGTGPLGAIGHLGFTGTSLWIDRDRALVCVLLTNHVHPDGANRPRMNDLRARFHDAVAEAVPG